MSTQDLGSSFKKTFFLPPPFFYPPMYSEAFGFTLLMVSKNTAIFALIYQEVHLYPTENIKMGVTDAEWIHRAGCVLCIAMTYAFAFSAAKREEVVDSVRWHSSPIDWCEDNYEHHTHIAEFWNVMSGLIVFPLTGLAWVLHVSMRKLVEPRFAFCLITLSCVGIGTMYFHSTLSKLGQILDEITICWTNYYAIILVIPKLTFEQRFGKTTRRLIMSIETLTTVILTTPIWALLYPWMSHLLTVLTIVLLPWAIITQFRAQNKTEASQRILKIALTCHATGVTCWALDRLACNQLTAMLGFYPQLHAWWHVFVFLGAYMTVVGVTWVVCLLRGGEGRGEEEEGVM